MYKRVINKKSEKPFYIGDIIAVVLLIAVIIATCVMATKPEGSTVEIYVDGELKYSYSLSTDREIDVSGIGHNTVVISGGKVYVKDADCNNKTCVKSKAISQVGEQITCLPNKMVVVITGEGGEIDATT